MPVRYTSGYLTSRRITIDHPGRVIHQATPSLINFVSHRQASKIKLFPRQRLNTTKRWFGWKEILLQVITTTARQQLHHPLNPLPPLHVKGKSLAPEQDVKPVVIEKLNAAKKNLPVRIVRGLIVFVLDMPLLRFSNLYGKEEVKTVRPKNLMKVHSPALNAKTNRFNSYNSNDWTSTD